MISQCKWLKFIQKEIMLFASMELIMVLPKSALKLALINGASITANLLQQK
jgi:hypothetical protein